MTYWKELIETLTCGWEPSRISAANLILPIAPTSGLLENI